MNAIANTREIDNLRAYGKYLESGEVLNVNGDLNLRNCTSLTNLPSGLIVGRNLYLENCANIESLPSCIFEWGPSDSGEPHQYILVVQEFVETKKQWNIYKILMLQI